MKPDPARIERGRGLIFRRRERRDGERANGEQGMQAHDTGAFL